VIGHEKDFLANRLKPLDVSEGLSFMPLVSMPKHTIAVEEKVVVFGGQFSNSGPVDLEFLSCLHNQ